MEQTVNEIRLCGTLAGTPKLSHENHGTRFYTFPLEVPRLSGTADTLPVVVSEARMEACDPFGGDRILVTGQIRSRNLRTPEGRKLLLSVFAETLAVCGAAPCNDVSLRGALCRAPVFRRTPLGREICDLMLAVGRGGRRTDYLPCILWGRTAREISRLPAGAWVSVEGRFQSREYCKVLDTGRETRVAYEISALSAAAD